MLRRVVPTVVGATTPVRRFLASASSESSRIPGIIANPESLGSQILPGGRFITKKDPKTGQDRSIMVERALGHFWMMNDVFKTNKTVLSNKTIIPEEEAQVFPTLSDNVSVLSTNELVDVPSYFLRNNRAKDPSAECTLVAIAYKDFGFKLLPSWTTAFEQAFSPSQQRAKVMRLSITEGKMTKLLLSRFMKASYRKSIPPEHHDSTLLCFGPDPEVLRDFNDALRMHNTLTGYVYLLDGLGRVRFAGSGEASEEEAQRLVKFAKQLTPRLTGR